MQLSSWQAEQEAKRRKVAEASCMTCDMSKLAVVKSERRQEDEEIYDN